MKYFIKIVLIAIIMIAGLLAQNEVVNQSKYSDYNLENGDTLKANVHIKVFVGNVNIAGVVNGDITVYGGKILIDSTAVINGKIKNIGGKIIEKENAVIDGEIVEARIKGNRVKAPKLNWSSNLVKINSDFDSNVNACENISHTFKNVSPLPNFHPGIDYNRQQGLYFHIGNVINSIGNLEKLDAGAKVGYSFGMKEWEAGAMIGYNFFKKNRLFVYANLYHQTEHFDNWRANDLDNLISFVLKKEDNFDRILVEGYKLGIQQKFSNFMKLKLEYVTQTEDTIGLYKESNSYRPIATNIDGLSFASGKINGVRISNSISLGKTGMTFPGEMLLSGIYESYGFGTGWSFDKLHLEANYIATIAETIQNRTRIMSSVVTGSSNVDHPVQYEYWLGGMGSLRGIPYKSLQGNKMLLINQEVGIGFSDIWVFGFVDAGIIDNTVNNSPFSDVFDFDGDMETTFGIGIETGDLYEWGVRFDIAKDISTDDAPWIGYFRMSRLF